MIKKLKNSINSNLSKRMIYTYVSIFIVILLTSTSISFFYVRGIITESIEETLQGEADLIVSMVEVAADASIKNYLRTTAIRNLELSKMYYDKYLSGELSEEEAKNKAWELMTFQKIGTSGYIYVLGSDGVLRYHPELIGSNLSDYDFINKQIEFKDGYMEYNWKNPSDIVEREKALYMVYFEPWDWIISVSSYKSEFRELIDVHDFEEEVLSTEFGKKGYSIIISGGGEFLIHPSYQGRNLIEEGNEQGYVVDMVLKQRNGVIRYDWKNTEDNTLREKIAYIAEIKDYDWFVMSTSYFDEIYKPLDLLSSVYLVIILISIGVIFMVTIRISDSILYPLFKLKSDMNDVKEGVFKGRTEVKSADEIGALREYFYDFMDDLEEKKTLIEAEMIQKEDALKQLELMNKNLEKIVEQRTEELREAQGQLIQAEKYSAITKTVANIAHHINTPLGTCITLVSYLKNSVEGLMVKNEDGTLTRGNLVRFIKDALESLDIITESLDRSSRTIKSFKLLEMDYSRKSIEIFSVNELVEDCIKEYNEEYSNYGYNFELISESYVEMKTYKELMRVIIHHLIANSLRHGFIGRESGKMTVTIDELENEILYIHEDDGVGISEDDLPNIFEPFYSKKDKMDDVGLGLNTVYNSITSILGGSIVCESKLGEGTRFTIKIPLDAI